MADAPTQPVVEEEVALAEPTQTPEPEAKEESEEQAEPVIEPPEAANEPAQESGEEEAPAPPSRREQLRIQTLLSRYPDLRDRAQQAPSQRRDALNYEQALDADPEVIRQLEADRQANGQAQYNEGLSRAEFLNWNTSLKIEAPTVEAKYPILDKNSPEFHPAVADALNSWYLKMSGFDPNSRTVANSDISYADFVESNMELVEEIAGAKNAQTVQNVAKQAAATGLRPDGSSAKRLNLNQAPENMTMEELYASIGQTMPKKS